MDRKQGIEWLICAATPFELAAFQRDYEIENEATGDNLAVSRRVACVVTGVGIPETLICLPRLVQTLNPLRILNIGIAGAYPNSGLDIGDIVLGSAETWGDIGFELPDAPGFQPIAASPFGAFYTQKLPLFSLPEFSGEGVKTGVGCTVNACTGTEQTGQWREQLFAAHFETMEGAAVAQVGAMENIPVCEVRAISNSAARRDMRPENIQLALANLRRYLQACREKGNF